MVGVRATVKRRLSTSRHLGRRRFVATEVAGPSGSTARKRRQNKGRLGLWTSPCRCLNLALLVQDLPHFPAARFFYMASRLVEAVAAGDKAGAYALLQRGQPEWPNQAVSAVERGSVAKRGQLVRMLVLSGADPNCIFSDGLTALHHAARQDDRETARFLIQQGAFADAVLAVCA